MPSFQERVEAARAGTNPALICRMPTGWAALCDLQYLRGYTILLADPLVASLNDLDESGRARFLGDMARLGDALLEVTGAARINYAIAGNTDPFLHAHIVPRFADEPEALRHNHPWAYPPGTMDAIHFDPLRDQDLIRQLAAAIRKHS